MYNRKELWEWANGAKRIVGKWVFDSMLDPLESTCYTIGTERTMTVEESHSFSTEVESTVSAGLGIEIPGLGGFGGEASATVRTKMMAEWRRTASTAVSEKKEVCTSTADNHRYIDKGMSQVYKWKVETTTWWGNTEVTYLNFKAIVGGQQEPRCAPTEDLEYPLSQVCFYCYDCEKRGFNPDECDCGYCGSFGGCSWSCGDNSRENNNPRCKVSSG